MVGLVPTLMNFEVSFSFYALLTMPQLEPNTITQISINKILNKRKLQESQIVFVQLFSFQTINFSGAHNEDVYIFS